MIKFKGRLRGRRFKMHGLHMEECFKERVSFFFINESNAKIKVLENHIFILLSFAFVCVSRGGGHDLV